MSLTRSNDLPEPYRRLWNEIASEIGPAIINAIRKMGLPAVGKSATGNAQLSSVSHREARNALLTDYALHQDVIQDVLTAIWSASLRGKLPQDPNHGRRWIFFVLKKATQRRATAQAKYLLHAVESKTEEAALNHVADQRDPENTIDARRLVARLRGLIGELSEFDQRVLEAKLEEAYAELAEELGIEQGTLRTRACRICEALRRRLSDPDESDPDESDPDESD